MAIDNAINVIGESRDIADDWRVGSELFLDNLLKLVDTTTGFTNVGDDGWIPLTQFTADNSEGIITKWKNYLAKYDPEEEPIDALLEALRNFMFTEFPDDFESLEMKGVSLPEKDYTKPAISLPAAPTVGDLTEDFPQEPVLGEVDIPDQPTLPEIPDMPEFDPITIPDDLNVSVTPLTATLPTLNLSPPSNTFSFNEQTYSYAMLQYIEPELISYITEGDYGLFVTDAYEAQVWQRGRDRQAEADIQVMNEVLTRWSAKGFTLPQPVMNKVISDNRYRSAQELAEYNRQVSIEKVNLWLKRREFTLTLGQQIEQMLLTFHGSKMDRALQAERYAVDAAIQVFDASIREFNARVEQTRLAIEIFQAHRDKVLAELEIFKTKLQKAQLEADIQKTLVQVYLAQLEGVQSVVNIWRTQIEAASLALQIENQKLEIYLAKVKGFVEKIRAKELEIDLFKAILDGEKTKMDIYATEVNAYGVEVENQKRKSDIYFQQFQAKLQKNQLLLDEYRAKIEGDRVKAAIYELTIDKINSLFRDRIANFSAHIDEITKYIGVKMDSQKLNLDSAIQSNRAEIAKAQHKLDQFKVQADIKGHYSLAGAQLHTGLIGAVLNSIQTLVTQVETVTEE